MRFGIADEDFIRGDVPMTKAEIRAMVMVKADIQNTDWVLDIGAGTGSLSIEAALQASEGKVFAVERNEEGIHLIRQNMERFGISNIEPIHGTAPEALAQLPPVDVILIGGSGGRLDLILDESQRLIKPGGRAVMTAVTVETAFRLVDELKKRKLPYDGFQMQVNRLRKAGPYHLFQPLSPIFIITVVF